MIVVHHLIVGRSLFTVWLLEELGLEYELVFYRRDPQTFRAPPELREVHPLGKSPVIVDDGTVIAESGAIAAYLLERYDPEHRLGPARSDIGAWTRFVQWLHYPEGSAFAPLLLRMLLQRSGEPGGLIDAFADGEVKLQLDYISDSLGDHPFILGDSFSAADVGVAYIVSLAERLDQLGPYPSLPAYLERIRARPAFEKARGRTGE